VRDTILYRRKGHDPNSSNKVFTVSASGCNSVAMVRPLRREMNYMRGLKFSAAMTVGLVCGGLASPATAALLTKPGTTYQKATLIGGYPYSVPFSPAYPPGQAYPSWLAYPPPYGYYPPGYGYYPPTAPSPYVYYQPYYATPWFDAYTRPYYATPWF
jgi:hypothetical protein